MPYEGKAFYGGDSFSAVQLDDSKKYVVKVDQGVKKRFKRKLVGINKTADEVRSEIKRLQGLGFQYFIIEEYLEHDAKDEKYLSIERIRAGYKVLYSSQGGVNIEEEGKVKEIVIPCFFQEDSGDLEHFSEWLRRDSSPDARTMIDELSLSHDFFEKLLQYFDQYFLSFMEINPFVTAFLKAGPSTKSDISTPQEGPFILDLAVEVDSAARFFVQGAWSERDYRFGESKEKAEEEKNIEVLASKSQASFKIDLLNSDGSIWLLLSGGGASIVVADEGYNLGRGKDLANYGEYSGNPNQEETYLYTKNLLSLLLRSKAKKKVLVIAGGVANFTDVAKTFKGIMKAIEEVSTTLKEQGVKVYVRRGGPNQVEGLKVMAEFLQKFDLYGDVKGPELVLTDIVREAIGLRN